MMRSRDEDVTLSRLHGGLQVLGGNVPLEAIQDSELARVSQPISNYHQRSAYSQLDATPTILAETHRAKLSIIAPLGCPLCRNYKSR